MNCLEPRRAYCVRTLSSRALIAAKVDRFGGRDESLLVVFNPAKIIKVEAIPDAHVNLAMREVPLAFEGPGQSSQEMPGMRSCSSGVCVLDWGLARVQGAQDARAGGASNARAVRG